MVLSSKLEGDRGLWRSHFAKIGRHADVQETTVVVIDPMFSGFSVGHFHRLVKHTVSCRLPNWQR